MYCSIPFLVIIFISDESLALNLAYGGNAYQSSTKYGFVANRVVDGNTDTDMGGGSCCHTDNNRYSYLIVDLRNIATITVVVVFNREGDCGERLRNFTIEVSKKTPVGNDLSGFDLCNYHPQAASSGQKIILPCEKPTEGRYVKIQFFHDEDLNICGTTQHYLHICEMEVFATETTGVGRLFRVRENTKATGTVLFQENVSCVNECVLHCDQMLKCTALNIHQGGDHIMCELLNEVDPLNTANSGTPVLAVGWKHYY